MGAIYIGVMSGTSQDGVDCAAVEFSEKSVQLHATHVEAFPETLRSRLRPLMQNEPVAASEYGALDAQLGELFAGAVQNLLTTAGLEPQAVKAIGSHGHTVFHQPGRDGLTGFTLQFGDPNIIAARTGITTVADLRRMDMALGGEGAPLVPAFHDWLWSSPVEERVIANVGGIANISVLRSGQPVIGFDTGPGNTLLDQWCRAHQRGDFDQNGQWARTGKLQRKLLDVLLDDPYFARPSPKSTGREYFNEGWLSGHLADARLGDLLPEDVARTLLELTARTLSDAAQEAAPNARRLIVSGGGAHNGFLLERLAALRPGLQVTTSEPFGLPPDWVEAAAFAWLARQRLNHEAGNVPSVTGARHEAVLGAVYSLIQH